MSIFEDEQSKKQVLTQFIKVSVNNEFDRIVMVFTDIFDKIWNNPDFTPQEVFDALGTDASKLFIIAGTFQQAVNAIEPNTLTQVPPKSYTLNQDGTVTITN